MNPIGKIWHYPNSLNTTTGRNNNNNNNKSEALSAVTQLSHQVRKGFSNIPTNQRESARETSDARHTWLIPGYGSVETVEV